MVLAADIPRRWVTQTSDPDSSVHSLGSTPPSTSSTSSSRPRSREQSYSWDHLVHTQSRGIEMIPDDPMEEADLQLGEVASANPDLQSLHYLQQKEKEPNKQIYTFRKERPMLTRVDSVENRKERFGTFSQSPSMSILQIQLDAANCRSRAPAGPSNPLSPSAKLHKENQAEAKWSDNREDSKRQDRELPRSRVEVIYQKKRLEDKEENRRSTRPLIKAESRPSEARAGVRTQNPAKVQDISDGQASVGNRRKTTSPRQESAKSVDSTKQTAQPGKKWQIIREKHCPVTSEIVSQGKGESVRSSILQEKKFSFKNLKLTKATTVKVGPEEVKLKEVTSTKAFEDRATHILNEMRKQRRSLQLEYVAKVSVPKKVSGWRDKLNRSESLKKEEKPQPQNLNKKRSSITKLAGQIKRKLSFSKPDGKEERSTTPYRENSSEETNSSTPVQWRSLNPLDFILMKEEYIKKNPPPPRKEFHKERSVESESGEQSVASVMNSLKKIVKAINPKREFLSDFKKKEEEERLRKEEEEREKKKLREEILLRARPNTWGFSYSWEARMRNYRGAAITPYNVHAAARWNSLQDLRQVEEDRMVVTKKAVRERIQNKVLSLINQPQECRVEVRYREPDLVDYSVRGVTIRPVRCLTPWTAASRELIPFWEAVGYRRRELSDIIAHFSRDGKSKRKSFNVKPVEHGRDKSESRFSYGVIVRGNSPWETVDLLNVAVKKKTEMFSSNLQLNRPIRAKVSIEGLYVAVSTNPGTIGTAKFCDSNKWENLKGCALFSIVGQTTQLPVASLHRRLVMCLHTEDVLGEETKDAFFVKCERKPQSQLVKDVVAKMAGCVSRISFHCPPTFNRFEDIMVITRYLRTKKNVNRYKWKTEDVLIRLIEGTVNDRKISIDEGFLSYGTV